MSKSIEGWYALAITQAFRTMAEASDLSDSHEDYTDDDKARVTEVLKKLDARAYGAGVVSLDGVLIVAEKLRTGAVVGMLTYPEVRADSPSDAVRLAQEYELNHFGPLAVKFLRLEGETPTTRFLN